MWKFYKNFNGQITFDCRNYRPKAGSIENSCSHNSALFLLFRRLLLSSFSHYPDYTSLPESFPSSWIPLVFQKRLSSSLPFLRLSAPARGTSTNRLYSCSRDLKSPCFHNNQQGQQDALRKLARNSHVLLPMLSLCKVIQKLFYKIKGFIDIFNCHT